MINPCIIVFGIIVLIIAILAIISSRINMYDPYKTIGSGKEADGKSFITAGRKY